MKKMNSQNYPLNLYKCPLKCLKGNLKKDEVKHHIKEICPKKKMFSKQYDLCEENPELVVKLIDKPSHCLECRKFCESHKIYLMDNPKNFTGKRYENLLKKENQNLPKENNSKKINQNKIIASDLEKTINLSNNISKVNDDNNSLLHENTLINFLNPEIKFQKVDKDDALKLNPFKNELISTIDGKLPKIKEDSADYKSNITENDVKKNTENSENTNFFDESMVENKNQKTKEFEKFSDTESLDSLKRNGGICKKNSRTDGEKVEEGSFSIFFKKSDKNKNLQTDKISKLEKFEKNIVKKNNILKTENKSLRNSGKKIIKNFNPTLDNSFYEFFSEQKEKLILKKSENQNINSKNYSDDSTNIFKPDENSFNIHSDDLENTMINLKNSNKTLKNSKNENKYLQNNKCNENLDNTSFQKNHQSSSYPLRNEMMNNLKYRNNSNLNDTMLCNPYQKCHNSNSFNCNLYNSRTYNYNNIDNSMIDSKFYGNTKNFKSFPNNKININMSVNNNENPNSLNDTMLDENLNQYYYNNNNYNECEKNYINSFEYKLTTC